MTGVFVEQPQLHWVCTFKFLSSGIHGRILPMWHSRQNYYQSGKMMIMTMTTTKTTTTISKTATKKATQKNTKTTTKTTKKRSVRI